ncbi:MAG TPA: CoA-binding protein [Ferruginibacter sp.]|nr:CoA-binding protein [Ferruginibacter sp.]HRE63680.1 CoA-binding protein [Ferruginibacter sp.]
MNTKKTLVLGASENPARYSYLAINKLKQYGHPVIAIGKKAGKVNGISIQTGQPELQNIDTVTLYINPATQQNYYNYILSLKPARIIFNPGTENASLEELAEKSGIKTIEACTLVMLATNQY